MAQERKIYFVMAGGGHDTDRHYIETIKNKRSVKELSQFITPAETGQLERYSHGRPYAIWGAVPGSSNIRNWEAMEEGDYVMVYRKGKIILAAEIALKTKNPQLAEYLWQKDENGKTWELVYFMLNEFDFDVDFSLVNKYLGYKDNYHPQGFMAIEQAKANSLLSTYGDLISFLQRLQSGKEPEEVDLSSKRDFQDFVEEKVERAPTEHDEMQWRLISLGNKTRLDVWVPPNDQGKEYQGNKFREHIISEFHESLDTPTYVKNIDTVWKLGLSIKAAFEIENSTSIYSGILRLSDLRALAPNSNYPLFIVADRSKKTRVFEQLRRPTFSNEYLQLDRAIHFLSYDNVRTLDDSAKLGEMPLDMSWLSEKAESAQIN